MTLGKAKQENRPQSDVHKSLVKLVSSPEKQPPKKRAKPKADPNPEDVVRAESS